MDENDKKKMKEIIKVAIKEYLEKRKKEFEKQFIKVKKYFLFFKKKSIII